jgi:hypothetical protein
MTLRIMLVGLVASMGFELPSGGDLSSWTQSGREWVNARMADLTGSVVEADCLGSGSTGCLQAESPDSIGPSVVAEPAKAADDAAFDAVSEAMVAEFVADTMPMAEMPSPIEDDPATVGVEAPPVGLPDGEELAAQVAPASDVEPADAFESDDMPADATTETEEAEDASRADRVSSALRVTGEAVRAWVSLIRVSTDEPYLAY